MSEAPPTHEGRFPGLDVLGQRQNWDDVTTGLVLSRIGMPSDIRFFTPAEQAVATALCDQLLDQHQVAPSERGSDRGERIPVVNLIDARLAAQQTDGWHFEEMPEDSQAWRETLAWLDADAEESHGTGFAQCAREQQADLVQAVQDLGTDPWHGLSAKHVWSLWTRYACTAYYSHPAAWDEIGFSGPAYPRGYKNIGVDALEPFEVRDAKPGADPVGNVR